MRFIPLLVLYSFIRLLFVVLHRELFQDTPAVSLAGIFTTGLFIDVAALSLINMPYFLLLLWARFRAPEHRFDILLNVLFLVLNLPFLLINVADLEYFRYTGERANASLFDMAWDISQQSGQMAFYFWWISLLGALLSFALCFFLPKGSPHARPSWRKRGFGVQVSLLVAGLVLITRGTGGLNGLSPPLDDWASRQAALNSSITMFRGWESCGAEGRAGRRTSHQVKDNLPVARPLDTSAAPIRNNLVLIVVESLSTEYTGVRGSGGYTPFLNRLAREGMSFTNHFANGRRSIDALSSILLGVPRLRESAHRCARSGFITGFPEVLRQHGYRTILFHGGWKGTLGLDDFHTRAGFDRYFSADDYPEADHVSGALGVYDGPFLRFTATALSRAARPFAATVMTVSTHQPYEIPAEYKKTLTNGTLPIHATVAYSDQALESFFAAAAKEPWYRDTLFIITGDHTGPAEKLASRLIDGHRVPLILYHPGRRLPEADRQSVAQHVDIGPTILGYLGISPAQLTSFGRNVFDPAVPAVAFGQTGGERWIATDGFYLETGGGRSKLFEWERLQTPVENDSKRRELEARLEQIVAGFDATIAKAGN